MQPANTHTTHRAQNDKDRQQWPDDSTFSNQSNSNNGLKLMRERRRRVTFQTKDRYRYTVCKCKRQKQKLHFGEFELLARHICSISLLPIGLMPQVWLDLSDWMHTALIQITTCLNTENANVHTALRHLHSHTANVCTLYSLLFRSSWLHEFMTRKCNFFFTHCCSGANRFACVGVFHISSFFKPKKKLFETDYKH